MQAAAHASHAFAGEPLLVPTFSHLFSAFLATQLQPLFLNLQLGSSRGSVVGDLAEGDAVGDADGDAVGDADGDAVGDADGDAVGDVVDAVGDAIGGGVDPVGAWPTQKFSVALTPNSSPVKISVPSNVTVKEPVPNSQQIPSPYASLIWKS